MSKSLNLINSQFGYLTVTKRLGSKWGHSLWECKCKCGNTCERTSNQLTMNNVVSCGCRIKESESNGRYTHGKSRTRLYRIWKDMKSRCDNSNVPYFKYYGGKGIVVCKEWANDFQVFYDWSINNGYDESLTIDRIDGNGNYEPSNCRWVTMTVQNQNKAR